MLTLVLLNIHRCFWCNAAEFTKKIKVSIGCSPSLKFGDFDFFGEFHDVTPKTPIYMYIKFWMIFVGNSISYEFCAFGYLKNSDMTSISNFG